MAALLLGQPIAFDWRPSYLVSLAYLSIFGSVIAFWAYLSLVANIGADRAAYAGLLFPVAALLISTVFEGYQWSLVAAAGLVGVTGQWAGYAPGA